MSAQQLEMAFGHRERSERIARELLGEARRVVEEDGVKSLAYEWDIGHSELGKKLDERDRHYLKPRELVEIMLRDKTGRVFEMLALALGYDVQRRRELSPQEKLERLMLSLDRAGPAGRAIMDDAFGKAGSR